jgi:hypothetical protein
VTKIIENKVEGIKNLKFKILNFSFLMIFMSISITSTAQELDLGKEISPRGAFLRSLVLPGWGHQYIDKTDWKRGQYHMAADAIMILSYAGISIRSNTLETELETFARANAGIDLSNKNRDFFLAVANYDNLQEYNDFQLRSRNWDNLIADEPVNRWNWSEDDNRFHYQDMRERIDRNNNQLPALLTLMVANRVVSGISAFVKARNMARVMPETRFSYLNEFGEPGFTATMRFGF